MSLHIWTPDALRSEARPLSGLCWRLVEAQHRISTMKLVDTLDEQALLEEELERTKPPVPGECTHLHYLLSTPFRYGRYPGNSRFRREGYSPGVFYGSEHVASAVAETAFYRMLFFAESPATPLPANPLEFTAFQVSFAADAIDLTAQPLAAQRRQWTDPRDYTACLDLADRVRAAGLHAIRYQSVRDPQGRANLALLSCTVFRDTAPRRTQTWRLRLSMAGVIALGERPGMRLEFPSSGPAGP